MSLSMREVSENQARAYEPLRYVQTSAGQSFVEAFSSSDPAREWTVRELAEWVGIGGRGPITVGSAATVADELEAWVAETGVDGFNLGSVVMPETFEQIADLLVPELQRRGLFKKDYAPGTLRNKLFGRGDAIAAGHPAHAARNAVRETAVPARPASAA
jgi:long-chain alkane monooxygenase